MRISRFSLPIVFLVACSSDAVTSGPGAAGGSGGPGGSGVDAPPPGKGGSNAAGGAGGSSAKGGTSGGGATSGSAGAAAGAAGTGAKGGSAGAGAKGGSAGAGTGGGAGGASGAASLSYPLTLTPLTAAQTSTANMSLFFSLTDAMGAPVIGFGSDDFEVREDGAPIAKNESDFQAAALSGQTLDVPTVILLDLSGSIVSGGALEKLKQAALAIVDGAFPEQRLSLVSFADTSKVRVPFTKDKAAVKAAIQAITDKDGLSTNLYGAISDALAQWQDGFVGTGSSGRLTSGFVLAVTDGADTAGVKKLEDVIKQRGSKRVITVGVGSDVNVDALKKLGNAGYISSNSFDALITDVAKINVATQALGKSIYRASYCSPKLAGQHELLFYPKGNPTPDQGPATCSAPTFTTESDRFCNDAGYLPCGRPGGVTKAVCCPPTSPYACGSTSKCYATADAAKTACGAASSCVTCQLPTEGGNALVAGPYIEVGFNANGHSTQQCPAAWGPSCKKLDACCGTLPADTAQQCTNQLVSLKGAEASCETQSQKYCPVYSAACSAAKSCCESLTDQSQRTSCLSQAANNASNGNDAGCTQLTKNQCPTYSGACAELKACCDSLPAGEEREGCLQMAKSYAAGNDQTSCAEAESGLCPGGGSAGSAGAGGSDSACAALATCCAQLEGPSALDCYSKAKGGDEAACALAAPKLCPK